MTSIIYSKVEKLCKKYKTRDPYELANALGIIVLFRDLKLLKGFYTIDKQTRYIAINQQLDENRQKLICAHELGHDSLHQHYAQFSYLRDFTLFDYTGRIEHEANLFASDLIIPDTDLLLKACWECYTYKQIARVFRVPEQLVRLKAFSMEKRGHRMHIPESVKSDFIKDV